MIKNSLYTYDYFQPEEYHFSLDSVFLAQIVAKMPEMKPMHVLDLCAGCGIIGLELSLHSPNKEMSIDFLEVQDLYRPYFEKNLNMIYPDPEKSSEFKFLNLNYESLICETYENSYDLIVCNPPYFFKGEGLLSPSDFKNRCRFFIDSSFEKLILATLHVLKPNASAYLLVRNGSHHGRIPLNEINSILGLRAVAQIIDKVRGTDIIQIRKESY